MTETRIYLPLDVMASDQYFLDLEFSLLVVLLGSTSVVLCSLKHSKTYYARKILNGAVLVIMLLKMLSEINFAIYDFCFDLPYYMRAKCSQKRSFLFALVIYDLIGILIYIGVCCSAGSKTQSQLSSTDKLVLNDLNDNEVLNPINEDYDSN